MGWSKWPCQFFFLQLLILLPLSLELELHPIEEDSSCQSPRYQPAYPNLAVDQYREKVLTILYHQKMSIMMMKATITKKDLLHQRMTILMMVATEAPIKIRLPSRPGLDNSF
ncbi:hypothetical protein WN944_024607 [Citrus x changshan-huyou]|uniref:Uncharacterized protein n=1 Tax=Citrus x changshan-huyou TaxID=2935761 RepID=A0AAP0LUJ5_9ROSI